MKKNKIHIFISGIFRSGTTLTTRSLMAHPAINVVYQPFTPFFRIWRDQFFKQIAKRSFNADQPMGGDYFNSEKEQELFNCQALDVQFDSFILEDVKKQIQINYSNEPNEKSQVIIDSLCQLRPGRVDQLLNQFMSIIEAAMPKKEALVIGLKELWCEEFFIPLMNTLNYKVVHLIRDPRAVFASRNSGKHLGQCGNKKYPLLYIVRAWRRSYYYWLVNRTNPCHIGLRYEDIVLKPEQALTQLCDCLDIRYHPDMANPRCYKDGQGKPWCSNSTINQTRDFNTASINYWCKVLSQDEIGMIEFLCRKEMAALSYKRVQPGFLKENFMSFKEDESMITEWLRRSPYLLDDEQRKRELARCCSGTED